MVHPFLGSFPTFHTHLTAACFPWRGGDLVLHLHLELLRTDNRSSPEKGPFLKRKSHLPIFWFSGHIVGVIWVIHKKYQKNHDYRNCLNNREDLPQKWNLLLNPCHDTSERSSKCQADACLDYGFSLVPPAVSAQPYAGASSVAVAIRPVEVYEKTLEKGNKFSTILAWDIMRSYEIKRSQPFSEMATVYTCQLTVRKSFGLASGIAIGIDSQQNHQHLAESDSVFCLVLEAPMLSILFFFPQEIILLHNIQVSQNFVAPVALI